ncbi:MAG TPA: ArsB/NhaD family transporter [Bacilli bacterium]
MAYAAELAVVIFLAVYALIVSEKIHRTIAAILGASFLFIFGITDQTEAVRAIDFNTLGLLIGMMMIVAITAETGLFRFAAIWTVKKTRGKPLLALAAFCLITAFASAFLDNVTTVLLIVPVTFSICRMLGISPLPFLLMEIFASNIGGTATLIGDPPNLMIGSANRELTFMAFLDNLSIICLIILALVFLFVALLYRKQLRSAKDRHLNLASLDAKEEITDKVLLIKCLFVLCLTIGGFFAHQWLHMETATIALIGAFLLLLLTGGKSLERAFAGVEWPTIFFFIGLFVLVSGLVKTGVIAGLAREALALTGGSTLNTSFLILWFSGLASAFVDNIPLVAAMIPLIKEMGKLGLTQLDPVWWSLSLGACLGGNGTLIGASANVVVSAMAAKEGVHISFARFLLIGFPVMLISLAASSVYLYLRYFG